MPGLSALTAALSGPAAVAASAPALEQNKKATYGLDPAVFPCLHGAYDGPVELTPPHDLSDYPPNRLQSRVRKKCPQEERKWASAICAGSTI